MIDAADAVAEFVHDRKRADLETDRMLLFAVLRAIELMGEAASKVSVEVRTSLPGTPWKAIVGMRNWLNHGCGIAEALLAHLGRSYSKHAGVICAFGREYARPGILDPGFHRYLIDAQGLRSVADYTTAALLTADGIRDHVRQRRGFSARRPKPPREAVG